MITLVRDRQTIYYATYKEVEEITKDGYYTGARKKVYDPVVKTEMPISGARTAYGFVSNVVQMDFFGLDKPYSKTMWTHDMSCPITEETILWLNLGDIEEYSEYANYAVGDKVIHDGKIVECTKSVEAEKFNPTSWKPVPHNYIVTGISANPNMIGYAIKEVDFS